MTGSYVAARMGSTVSTARMVLLLLTGSAVPVAVGGSTLDGVPPPVWVVALAVALGVGWALLPESGFGTAGGLLVLGWWGLGAPEDLAVLSSGVLLAVAALLAGHLAAVLASYGPDEVPLDRGLTLLWVSRGAFVLLPALLAWSLAVAVAGLPAPPGVWVAGVLAVLATLVAGQAAMPRTEDVDE